MQAARDNIKDPPGIFVKVGLESLRGTLRFIHDDLPRAFGDLGDLHLLGDLADAATEASTSIAALRRVSRDRPRAAQQGLVPPRPRAVRAEVHPRRRPHDRRRSPAGHRHARAAEDAGRVPPRRVAGQRRRSAGRVAEDQGRSSAGRQAGRGRRGTARRARRLHPPRAHHHAARGRAGHRPADAAVLSLDRRRACGRRGRSSRGPFARSTTSPTSIPSWPAGAPGRAPARLQLRRALVDLDSRGVSRATSFTISTCARSSRRCANRSSSPRRRSSKGGRTTASR